MPLSPLKRLRTRRKERKHAEDPNYVPAPGEERPSNSVSIMAAPASPVPTAPRLIPKAPRLLRPKTAPRSDLPQDYAGWDNMGVTSDSAGFRFRQDTLMGHPELDFNYDSSDSDEDHNDNMDEDEKARQMRADLEPGSCKQVLESLDADTQVRCFLAGAYVRDAMYARGLDHVFKPNHLRVYNFTHSKAYSNFMMVVVIVQLSLILGEEPTLPNWRDYPATLVVELFLLIIHAGDSALTCYSDGYDNWKGSWHKVLKVVILVISVFDVIVALGINPAEGNMHFRISRLVRPLFLWEQAPSVRVAGKTAVRTAKQIAPVYLLIVLHVVFFGCLGYRMFKDFDDYTYFADLPTSFLSLFILVTTANFPDIMMPAYDVSRWYALFFVVFITFGIYFLVNLVLARVSTVYRSVIAHNLRLALAGVREALVKAYAVMTEDGGKPGISLEEFLGICHYVRPGVCKAHATAMYGCLDSNNTGSIEKNEFLLVFKFLNRQFKFQIRSKVRGERQLPGWKRRVRRVYKRVRRQCRRMVKYTFHCCSHDGKFAALRRIRVFRTFIDAVVLTGTSLMIVQLDGVNDSVHDSIRVWQKVALTIYVVEMVVLNIAKTPRVYWKSPFDALDGVLTVLGVFSELAVLSMPDSGSTFEDSLQYVRVVRLVRLLNVFPAFGEVMEGLVRVVPPSLSLLSLLFLVFYTFSVIGMELFAGKLGPDRMPPDTDYANMGYWLNNFDDFPASFVTLFELLLVNNWFVIMNGAVAATTEGHRWFFLAFYVVSVPIILNILVAFLIDAFMKQYEQKERDKKHNEAKTHMERAKQALSERMGQPKPKGSDADDDEPFEEVKQRKDSTETALQKEIREMYKDVDGVVVDVSAKDKITKQTVKVHDVVDINQGSGDESDQEPDSRHQQEKEEATLAEDINLG